MARLPVLNAKASKVTAIASGNAKKVEKMPESGNSAATTAFVVIIYRRSELLDVIRRRVDAVLWRSIL